MIKTDVSIVVPVYNEEKSVKAVIEKIKEVMHGTEYNYEIIAVDDRSRDESKRILEKIKDITVISNKENRGYGASLKTGIKNSSGDWIIITDSDGTYPDERIPDLLKYTKDFDMVIGARIGKDAKIPLFRRPVKIILNKFSGYLTGYDVLDLNSGLRVFKKDIVEKYWHILPDRFSFTSTLTMICLTNDYSVKFIPIDYHERIGTSSIHPIKDTIRFFSQIIRLTIFFNPLKVFIPLSFIFLFLSLLKGTIDFVSGNQIGNLAIILFFISTQAFFFGLLADMINKNVRY